MERAERNYSDEILVKQVQKGDRESFNILTQKYHKAIVNFIYRNINDQSRAEELAQKVFIRCYLNIKHYKPEHKFTTWLYTIAVNLYKNELRDKSRHPKQTPILETISAKDEKSFSPISSLVNKEMKEKIYGAIQTLPAEQRDAIIMAVYQEISYKEIADVLRTTENTVKSWIFRGKQHLYEQLKTYMD